MEKVTIPPAIEKLRSMFCICGNPGSAWQVFHAHLDRTAVTHDKRPELPDTIPGEWWIVAYLLDHVGATEHGGSVVAAWITDSGREALAFLEKYGDDWMDSERFEFYNSQETFVGGKR